MAVKLELPLLKKSEYLRFLRAGNFEGMYWKYMQFWKDRF